MAVITVVRVPASLGGTARRYRVLIDRVERGRLAGGEEIEVEVEAGRHQVEVRIDWTGTELIEVTLADSETASFAVEPAAQTNFGQFTKMFGRHGFLKLRRIAAEA